MPLLACFPYLAFLRGDPCEVLPEEQEENDLRLQQTDAKHKEKGA